MFKSLNSVKSFLQQVGPSEQEEQYHSVLQEIRRRIVTVQQAIFSGNRVSYSSILITMTVHVDTFVMMTNRQRREEMENRYIIRN